MPRKKAAFPAEAPEIETANPAPEAASEEPAVSISEKPGNTSDPAQAIPQKSSQTASPKNNRAIVCARVGLNLRAGPGPGFEVGAVLPDGAEVSLLTLLAEGGPQGVFEVRVPGWKYVFTGQMVGWVDSSFLDEADHGNS